MFDCKNEHLELPDDLLGDNYLLIRNWSQNYCCGYSVPLLYIPNYKGGNFVSMTSSLEWRDM